MSKNAKNKPKIRRAASTHSIDSKEDKTDNGRPRSRDHVNKMNKDRAKIDYSNSPAFKIKQRRKHGPRTELSLDQIDIFCLKETPEILTRPHIDYLFEIFTDQGVLDDRSIK